MKAMSANIYTRFAKYMHTFAICIHLHKQSDLADYKVWWQPTINRPLKKKVTVPEIPLKNQAFIGDHRHIGFLDSSKTETTPGMPCQFTYQMSSQITRKSLRKLVDLEWGKPSGSPVSNLASWKIPASSRIFPVRGFSSLTLDQRPTAGRLTLGKLHLAPLTWRCNLSASNFCRVEAPELRKNTLVKMWSDGKSHTLW